MFVEACLLKPFLDCFSVSTLKKPAKRGPKPKQIGTWAWLIVGHVGALYTSMVLCNYPVPLKLQRIFFFSQTEDQSSRVCSHCSNQVRSTRAGSSFIKASFQESQHDDDSIRFLKTSISTSPHGSVAW